jgi:hypothetical protein
MFSPLVLAKQGHFLLQIVKRRAKFVGIARVQVGTV